jgi:hypothetical protein
MLFGLFFHVILNRKAFGTSYLYVAVVIIIFRLAHLCHLQYFNLKEANGTIGPIDKNQPEIRLNNFQKHYYRKVASTNASCLVTHLVFFWHTQNYNFLKKHVSIIRYTFYMISNKKRKSRLTFICPKKSVCILLFPLFWMLLCNRVLVCQIKFFF